MDDISEAIATAVEYHQAGRLADAERIYREVLADDANHAQAWHLLGVVCAQRGDRTRGVECLRRALAINPRWPEAWTNLGKALIEMGDGGASEEACRHAIELNPQFYVAHSNLGEALFEQKRFTEAIASFRRALELKPDLAAAHLGLGRVLWRIGQVAEATFSFVSTIEYQPDFTAAHFYLGNILQHQGRLEAACAAYSRAVALSPAHVASHFNLGLALKGLRQFQAAAATFRRLLELEPAHFEALNDLGFCLHELGQKSEANACFERAIELYPKNTLLHFNFGVSLVSQGRLDEAVRHLRNAIQLDPNFPAAYYNLGVALQILEQLDEAAASYLRSLELQPNQASAHYYLGGVRKSQGRVAESMAAFRQALDLKPDYVEAWSEFLQMQTYCPGLSPQDLQAALHRWNQQNAEPLARLHEPHANDRSPGRKLRIGYVSMGFGRHVVGRNLLPLFREHDRQQFEICCYADVQKPDELTEQFQGLSSQWCDARGLTDGQLADQIRADQIDILVDLALHTTGNRLLVFAQRPAPVQVTFAGYPGSTGLTTIDYRITDPWLDPPGLDDAYYSETSVRLPDSFWCYDAQSSAPPVNSLPAAETGFVSFGCLNQCCKVNSEILDIWARILRQVPGSRLSLLTTADSQRQATLDRLASAGVARERVCFIGLQARYDYLSEYHNLDISLDTVPYNGHTSSLDSLWMGVPVVTLVGNTVVGRAGVSQLTNLGLTEFIASTSDEYVARAVALAADLPRLRKLRQSLRERMLASPLTDAPRFARNLEAAYRDMWRAWCDDRHSLQSQSS